MLWASNWCLTEIVGVSAMHAMCPANLNTLIMYGKEKTLQIMKAPIMQL
jgi:hypothetical protein